jgi:predicted MFS family arabinose efflux permease
VIVSTGGIVGSTLAPDQGLATLPISMMVLGIWAGTLPLGALCTRCGRRFALQVGSIFGIACGLIACVAVLRGSFTLFNVGAFCAGLYASAHLSYRFAATDTSSEAFRPKAIAWVLAGGVFAGVLGPQLVIATKDIWPLFAATYVAQAMAAALVALILARLKMPRVPPERQLIGGRPSPRLHQRRASLSR